MANRQSIILLQDWRSQQYAANSPATLGYLATANATDRVVRPQDLQRIHRQIVWPLTDIVDSQVAAGVRQAASHAAGGVA